MIDNEIIKALECCIPSYHKNCNECVYSKNKSAGLSVKVCSEDMRSDALDLIKRQKAEIERLTSGKCVYLSDDETTEYCVEGPCPYYKTEAQIRAEAIKEFAERLKKISNISGDILGWRDVTTNEMDIDNLVKEMVGDTE